MYLMVIYYFHVKDSKKKNKPPQLLENAPALPLLQVKGMGLDLNQTEKTDKGEG